MTLEESKAVADCFVSALENETKTTIKVLAAVPENKSEYRPDPRSKNALQLAAHIVVEDLWFLEGLGNGQFAPMESVQSAETAVTSIAQAIDMYQTYNHQRGSGLFSSLIPSHECPVVSTPECWSMSLDSSVI